MSQLPAVSVLTCVYNGEQLLGQAIESILAQTRTDFEYIIVDDGSQDETYAVAARYAAKDARIVLLRNESNLGISRATNRGVAAARGEFVLVLDHDDLAHPTRLALQAAFLAARPEVGVVGSHLELVDLAGTVVGSYRPPVEPLRLRWEVLFRCAVPIGAGCFRRALLERVSGLWPAFGISGDYELLTRLVGLTQLAVIPELLLTYRVHPAQNTRTRADRTHWEALIAVAGLWRNRLGLNASLGDVGIVYRGVNGFPLANQGEVMQACALVQELQRRFLAREAPTPADQEYLAANVTAKLAALSAHLTL